MPFIINIESMKFSLTIEDKTNILLAIFVAALVAANLLGSKITELFGIRTSVGILAYPITFLITDIIAEVQGRSKARSFILAGFVALILTLVLTVISVKMPPYKNFEYNTGYSAIFSNSIRMIIGSITAFVLSQLHDVWAFHFWKEKTKNKFLWLRNNFSTIVSQFIDTTVFMFIAFYLVTPKYTVPFIFSLIIPYWFLKVVFALCDTPFVYMGVKFLKTKNNLTPRLRSGRNELLNIDDK